MVKRLFSNGLRRCNYTFESTFDVHTRMIIQEEACVRAPGEQLCVLLRENYRVDDKYRIARVSHPQGLAVTKRTSSSPRYYANSIKSQFLSNSTYLYRLAVYYFIADNIVVQFSFNLAKRYVSKKKKKLTFTAVSRLTLTFRTRNMESILGRWVFVTGRLRRSRQEGEPRSKKQLGWKQCVAGKIFVLGKGNTNNYTRRFLLQRFR